jgi:poly(3-hydroxybutyrate) depolymerase
MNLLRSCLPLGLGLYLAMVDAAAIEAARFSVAHFQAREGNRLTAFVYRGTAFDPVRGPIWFVMHGAGRNAEGYLRAAAPVAERRDALAIAIEFSRDVYRAQEDYTLNVGGYAEVERVFEAVRRLLGGRQQGYYLFGHSAGAQFVHRLITFLPDARVLGAVAANAGWYTLPVSGDAPHFEMPYGLRGSALERTDLRWLFAKPLTARAIPRRPMRIGCCAQRARPWRRGRRASRAAGIISRLHGKPRRRPTSP